MDHDPAVFTRSGSRFIASVGFGWTIAGSRNQSARFESESTSVRSLSAAFICAHTSDATCSLVHLRAGFPAAVCSPGVSQSEMSTDRIPPTDPSPSPRMFTRGQNWRCEMDVSAHGESM